MKQFNTRGAWLSGAAAAILIAGTTAAMAQAASKPHNEDVGGCSAGSGAGMAYCQNMMSNQQNDGTVGNGATPSSPTHTNGIGVGNNVNRTDGTTGGAGANPSSGTIGRGNVTGTAGGNGSNAASGTGTSNGNTGANGTNGTNGTGSNTGTNSTSGTGTSGTSGNGSTNGTGMSGSGN